jgi:hypothetical protein
VSHAAELGQNRLFADDFGYEAEVPEEGTVDHLNTAEPLAPPGNIKPPALFQRHLVELASRLRSRKSCTIFCAILAGRRSTTAVGDSDVVRLGLVTQSLEDGARIDPAATSRRSSWRRLLAGGFDALYVELWSEADTAKRKKKAASETRYTCPSCQLNAWAKPDVRLVCGDCDMPMQADEAEGEP